MMDTEVTSEGMISVIVPVYKVESYIQECMYSIIAQTYKNIEIILVDDCGNDKSVDIAREILTLEGMSWRVIHNENNKGLSYSRNVGVAHAKGEFLYFLDSDDYIDADCLKNLYDEIICTESDMVFGSIAYDVDGDIIPSPWCFTTADTSSEEPLRLYLRQRAFVMACNRLINKRFYASSGVFFKDDIIHEDEPWAFSLIIRAKKISFVKQITYYYRKHGESITTCEMNEFRLTCLFYHLYNCSNESYNYRLWENMDFRTWYARSIFDFCGKVIRSEIPNVQKCKLLDRVYLELRLPIKELSEIRMYSFAKRFSFLFPKYVWLKYLVELRTMKLRIMEKLGWLKSRL